MQNNIRLEGKRVILETLKPEEVPLLWNDSITEEVWRYLPKSFNNMADLNDIFAPSFFNLKQGTEHPFSVYDKELKLYVGSTRLLNLSIDQRNVEIGWTWFIPNVWKSRVNTECKYLLLKYCFEDLEMLRVQFKTDSRNLQSDRAILRLGAKKEGVLRKFGIMQDGVIRDANIYSILNDEWPEVEKQFEVKLLK
ncbi:putative acetyltransferase [Bacillus sp. TS-2]|nr:putative acetyltransferase [Bacillus sp. TS-2]